MDTPQPLVVGAAWYRENQWERLKEVSADRDRLEETWAEWLCVAEKGIRDCRARGLDVKKVDVDIEELVRWCQTKGQPVNGESRSAFAAQKLLDRGQKRGRKSKRRRR